MSLTQVRFLEGLFGVMIAIMAGSFGIMYWQVRFIWIRLGFGYITGMWLLPSITVLWRVSRPQIDPELNPIFGSAICLPALTLAAHVLQGRLSPL